MKTTIPHAEYLAKKKHLDAERKLYPAQLRQLTPAEREHSDKAQRARGQVIPHRVYRSREFLVQEFRENDVVRLSINRTRITKAGDWQDGITWEELQRLKAECGWGDSQAVEIFPPERDVVNLHNIRHLWIPRIALPFAWTAENS